MLKRTSLLFALLLINAAYSNAQSLSVGPMIGANVSKLTEAKNTSSLSGINIGAFANYSVNDHVGIGAKLLFSQLGTDYKGLGYINKLNYLQIPLTAIYYFGEAGNQFRPKIFGGPYVGSLLKATLKGGKEVTELNGDPTYKKIDVGAQAGIGFNYRIQSRTWVNVDAGFSQGFTDVTETPDTAYKNLAFGLNVGISFPVGKN